MAEKELEIEIEKPEGDEWAEIATDGSDESPKVEFELEGDESDNDDDDKPVEEKKAVVAKEDKEEEKGDPPELEGINTKGAQKRIRQLVAQKKQREEEATKLRQQIRALEAANKQKDEELTNSLKYTLDSSSNYVEDRIANAKRAFKNAADVGDSEAMLEANEALAAAHAEKQTLAQQKQAWEQYSEDLKNDYARRTQQVQQHPAAQQYDPKAVQWATKNNWFGNDQILTATALQIDAQLKDEGYDPSDDEFYEEVDKRLHNVFPHKFEAKQESSPPRLRDVETSNPSQVVAGASRQPQASSRKGNRVKLTQQDVQLANKWGIPLEQYAAQKLNVNNSDSFDSYTEIE